MSGCDRKRSCYAASGKCCPKACYTLYFNDNSGSLLQDTRNVSDADTVQVTLNGQLYRDALLATAFPNERLSWLLQTSFYDAETLLLASGQLTISIDDCINSGTLTFTTQGSNPAPDTPVFWSIASGTGSFFQKRGYLKFTYAASGLNTLEIFFQ